MQSKEARTQEPRTAREARGHQFGWFKKLIFALTPVVVLVALLELLLALFGVHTGYLLAPGRKAFTREELKAFWQIRKDTAGARVIEGTLVQLYRPVRSKYLNVNSLGFRGDEVGPKEPGEYRVAIVGGSTVYGEGVGDDGTISAFLAKAVKERFPEKAIKVYNLGVQATVFRHGIARVRYFQKELGLDLVIFYNGINDTGYGYRNGYCRPEPFGEEIQDSFFVRKQRAVVKLKQLLHKSRIFQVLREPLRRIRSHTFDEVTTEQMEENVSDCVTGYVEDAEGIRADLQASGVRVIFALQANLCTRDNKTPAEEKILRIEKAAGRYARMDEFYKWFVSGLMERAKDKGLGDVFFDLTGVFEKCDKQVFFDSAHLNPRGNQIVADRLAELIKTVGVVSDPGTETGLAAGTGGL